MIAITTNNSISVNPRLDLGRKEGMTVSGMKREKTENR
jgi:hypothetical protein